jgi:hypothetical protein
MAARQSSVAIMPHGYGHKSVKPNSLDAPIVYDVILHFKGEPQKRAVNFESSPWRKEGDEWGILV